jgi:phenylalanyl-tRNA synthetase beta chain
MKERIEACGMRSISLLVDITNYVMLESGQPLHAYDADSLRGPIRVRQAHDGEHLTTLDNQDRALVAEDMLITDDSGPIGLAGVMGGLTTELEATTTNIVIEAAQFDPASIGRTYRRHKLPSEASRRFERGVDTGVPYAAALRCAELMRDLAGAKIGELTVVGEVAPMPAQRFAAGLPQRILGTEVSPQQVVEILTTSGVQIDHTGTLTDETVLECVPPTWRRDLVDQYDYVEEIGRKIGLDVIAVVVPRAAAGRGYTFEQSRRRSVLQAVAEAGFVELITLPFLGDAELEDLGLDADDPRRGVVRLANPLSDTQPYLRTTLLPGLFASVNRNTSRSLDDLALFECGAVFQQHGAPKAAPMPSVDSRPSGPQIEELYASLPAQPRMIAAVLTGNWIPAGWQGKAVPADWTHAVWFAEVAAQALGGELLRRAAKQTPWHPGRCAELGVRGPEGSFKVVGHAGELHPSVSKAFGLPERTCAVELDLDAMIARSASNGKIRELSSFPLVKQDVALIVDASTSAKSVRDALAEGAGELLESVSLFDVFTGAQIGEGKKSLAFSLHFRSPDRTLTEDEASAARDAAVAAAVERCGAVWRG